MIKHATGISGILFAAAMASGISMPAYANDAPTQPTNANATNGQDTFCFDPNTRKAPRRIRNITRDNVVQIYNHCLEAENWVEAINIIRSPQYDLGPNRWHLIDQLLAIYDGKIERQTELTANLQDGARNSATGKEWTEKSRDKFQAELLKVNAWLHTVHEAFNPEYKDKVKRHAELNANLQRGARNPETGKKWTKEEKEGFHKELSDIEMYFDRANISVLKQWRNANAPTVESISPIANTACQNEVRVSVRFNGGDNIQVRENFMTCGTWRAPQVGPLRYQFRVNYGQMQTPPVPGGEQPAAPAQQLQPQ